MPAVSKLIFAGAALVARSGAVDQGRCCEECVAPKVKYYSVDTPHGHCGECCMEPKQYGLFKVFEPNLTLANGLGCKDMGWPKYDSTVTHGVWPISMTLDLFNSVDSAASTVTLHKVWNGKCGQATIDKAYRTVAADGWDLTEGLCSTEGYTVDAGSEELDLPEIGKVKVAMFTKPKELAAAAPVALEATGGHCCDECVAPKIKYYSVDTSHGHCGVCCMDPKQFKLFKVFEPNLTVADGLDCSHFGYPKYDSTVTHGVWPVSMTLDLFNPENSGPTTVTLRKIFNGKCGQATIDKAYETVASDGWDLTEGLCSAEGYTVDAGSQELDLPEIGKVQVALFTKPAELAALDVAGGRCCEECVAPKVKYFSVDTPHGHCGECCMDPKQFKLFKIFESNLTVANGVGCSQLGYPTYDSTVTHGVWPISMTLDLFNPAKGEVVV